MQWALKAQPGPLTPEESTQLQLWLEADSRHRGAYVRANAVRVTVQRVAALAGGATPAPPQKPWLARLRFPVAAPSIAAAPGIRLLAAAVVLFTLAAVVGWQVYGASGDRYVSGVGELRQVALEDGSSILLNTATKAVVHLGEISREVNLARGEALFEVAKDPRRPFLVHAGELTVKAIGTAFSVRREAGQIAVTVTEGVVELIQEEGESGLRLAADQRAVVAEARHAPPVTVQPLNRRETDRQLAWRTGRLEFDGQSLGDAVEQVNRYNRRHITVADPGLAGKPVVGVFRSVDAEAFAYIAAAALDAEVVLDGSVIRIEPKAAP